LAYQLYLKGRYYFDRRTPEALERGIEFFNQAIERDSNYAMAYVGLADLYYVLSDNAPVSARQTMPKARAAAEKALALDDSLAEPHAVLGGVYSVSLEWERAEREFRRGLEINPNEANAHNWYAYLLSSMGRSEEAIAHAKRATALEPLNLKYSDTVGGMYRDSGQYEEAIQWFKKNLEMNPSYAPSWANLSTAYQYKRDYDSWLQAWKKNATLSNDQEELAIAEEAARVYSRSGYQATIRESSNCNYNWPSDDT
jgi:tetratricopeptide (TPR) repeat protein